MADLNIKEWGDKTVGVVFRNTKYAEGHEKLYTYRVFLDMEVDIGDMAVVEKDGTYSIVTIKRIDSVPRLSELAPFKYKWLCCLIDRRQYERREKEEKKFSLVNAVKTL